MHICRYARRAEGLCGNTARPGAGRQVSLSTAVAALAMHGLQGRLSLTKLRPPDTIRSGTLLFPAVFDRAEKLCTLVFEPGVQHLS